VLGIDLFSDQLCDRTCGGTSDPLGQRRLAAHPAVCAQPGAGCAAAVPADPHCRALAQQRLHRGRCIKPLLRLRKCEISAVGAPMR